MLTPPDPLYQPNNRALLQLLIHSGPLTRVELAARSGLSKQTVSLVVRDLEDAGWVKEIGRIVGRVGRSPLRYEFNSRAGFVAGIDLGATTLRIALSDLAGTVLREASTPVDPRGGSQLVDEAVRATRDLADQTSTPWSQVRAVAMGTLGIVDPRSGVVRLANNMPEFIGLPLRENLRTRFGVPVLVDNEVNMSVRAERWLGHGRDCETFIALELGTGVGMGIVIGGEVHRGSAGAAGEVGFLPLGGGDPFNQFSRQRGAYEQACCGDALMRRYVEAGGQARTVADLFRAAEDSDDVARQAVGDHARLVALGLSAITSVLDPEVIVLGGIIGAEPGLLEPVRQELDRLMLTPPRVETTALGNRATLIGAVATALGQVHEELFGEPSIPVPNEPPGRESAAVTPSTGATAR